MRDQLHKIRCLIQNSRLEILLVILTIVLEVIFYMQPKEIKISIENTLICYITDNRISMITSVMAIFIGIYITVLTVIATSKISITELLLKSKMDGQILSIIGLGIIEDFALVILGVFIPLQGYGFIWAHISLLCIAMISFVKFSLLVYRIFKLNVEGMVKEIDADSQKSIQLFVKIEEILNRIKKGGPS